MSEFWPQVLQVLSRLPIAIAVITPVWAVIMCPVWVEIASDIILERQAKAEREQELAEAATHLMNPRDSSIIACPGGNEPGWVDQGGYDEYKVMFQRVFTATPAEPEAEPAEEKQTEFAQVIA